MKNLTQIALMAFGIFALTSCGEQSQNQVEVTDAATNTVDAQETMDNTNRGLYKVVEFKGATARLNKATDIIVIEAKKMQQ
mgnify:CR=1 FL=1